MPSRNIGQTKNCTKKFCKIFVEFVCCVQLWIIRPSTKLMPSPMLTAMCISFCYCYRLVVNKLTSSNIRLSCLAVRVT